MEVEVVGNLGVAKLEITTLTFLARGHVCHMQDSGSVLAK